MTVMGADLLRTAMLLLSLSACTAGPDFKRPVAPRAQRYTEAPLPATTTAAPGVTGGEPQHFVIDAEIPAEWWTLFHSPELDQLIARALDHNPDLEAAQAALRSAQETARAQQGGYYPSVASDFSAVRQKTSAQLSPTPNSGALYFNLYTPQVTVSYAPDVFGLNRRSVEFLEAQAEQAHDALLATRITLTSNVAVAAIEEASLQAQVDATIGLVAADTQMLQILRRQFDRGFTDRLSVAAQETQLAQVQATLPPLQKLLAQQRDLLADLTGDFPGAAQTRALDLASLQLPQSLPLSLPSRLVEQRPDVRQAEANLHAASAQIGIAAANRLPSFTLTADAGAMALAFHDLFQAGTGFWALAADASMPLFQGGALLHKEDAAKAAYDQAAAQYRSTVLAAFQNVADTLDALQQDAEALKAAAAAEQAAALTEELAQKQYQAGYSNSLVLLNAEQTHQQALIYRIQAQANRYADTVALFQALGGGWWNPSSTDGDAKP